ncbi:MAG: ABC transporter ATP-binding protein [Clostridiales bacterium]|nr:ABC transporter ATP-binding protein [Clostridiales bacterium]
MIIELDNVRKIYRTGKCVSATALDGVSLVIEQGEYVSFCGVSGSGKTTLLNLIGCLDLPSEGQVLLDGRNTSEMKDSERANIRNSKIGFVFQDYALIPYRTVYENLIVPAYFSSMPRKNFKIKAEKVLEKVGMKEYLKRPISSLSGGQKQRVAIARALMLDPDVILADEPSGALDSGNKKELIDLFRQINETGKTVIIVTHDNELANSTNKIIKLIDGKITEMTVN